MLSLSDVGEPLPLSSTPPPLLETPIQMLAALTDGAVPSIRECHGMGDYGHVARHFSRDLYPRSIGNE